MQLLLDSTLGAIQDEHITVELDSEQVAQLPIH